MSTPEPRETSTTDARDGESSSWGFSVAMVALAALVFLIVLALVLAF